MPSFTLQEVIAAAKAEIVQENDSKESGVVFQDIVTDTRKIQNGVLFLALKGERFDGENFAVEAVEKGADGLIAVCAGAGGHAGTTSPFALVQEIREWFDGPLALSGSIATGRAILAAQVMGADFAYMGSAFIATDEARAVDAYKQMIVDSSSADIVYASKFTGVHGNYLRGSIVNAGLDPDHLDEGDPSEMSFGSAEPKLAKAWKDIWGSGQGIGAIKAVQPTAALVARLKTEYAQARSALCRP